MSETKPDTVPGLGFKDKEKALETIKNLEGRDPDYQKLAIKGLIGRAKRTLTLTKDKDKVQNINEAIGVFDEWLANFEKKNLSKENRSYLPLAAIKSLLPLQKRYKIDNKQINDFLKAYGNVDGEYKNLRTVSSGDDQPTWDIVRNRELKKLLKKIDDDNIDLWKDDLPTKEHMEIILWAYSPDASKIKKNQTKFEEKLSSTEKMEDDDDDDDDNDDDKDEEKDEDADDENNEDKKVDSDKEEKCSKRKSEGEGSDDESPKKKKKT